MFSHLPLPVQLKQAPMPEELVLLLESLEISTVTVAQSKRWTSHDPVLAKVHKYVQQGWPRSVSPEP